jgi:hypothetical protein
MGGKEVKIKELVEKLKASGNEGEVLRNVLNKVSGDELDALYRFLFPDEPVDNPKADEIIKEWEEKGKRSLKVERKGNDVIIEIL